MRKKIQTATLLVSSCKLPLQNVKSLCPVYLISNEYFGLSYDCSENGVPFGYKIYERESISWILVFIGYNKNGSFRLK